LSEEPTTSWDEDGPIELDSILGKQLGFTSDKFDGWLWKDGEYIIVSFIESLQQGQGNLSKLFDLINIKGYGIKVPTPFARMQLIITAKGFKKIKVPFHPPDIMEPCEVWVKEPSSQFTLKGEKSVSGGN